MKLSRILDVLLYVGIVYYLCTMDSEISLSIQYNRLMMKFCYHLAEKLGISGINYEHRYREELEVSI